MKVTIHLGEVSSETRKCIAKDISMKSVLEELAKDANYEVREVVAGNANTSVEILVKLSEDEDHDVREVVAGNANTPVETLVKLSEDEVSNVRKAALKTLENKK